MQVRVDARAGLVHVDGGATCGQLAAALQASPARHAAFPCATHPGRPGRGAGRRAGTPLRTAGVSWVLAWR